MPITNVRYWPAALLAILFVAGSYYAMWHHDVTTALALFILSVYATRLAESYWRSK